MRGAAGKAKETPNSVHPLNCHDLLPGKKEDKEEEEEEEEEEKKKKNETSTGLLL